MKPNYNISLLHPILLFFFLCLSLGVSKALSDNWFFFLLDIMYSGYKPYYDPDFESLIERIHPPRVCIDNETCKDCTLVKVDSANKHGILLEMVQVLTDLDLIISKSYISSDGGWFMDVFHVTDQLGNKLIDESLIQYIQQALCAGRRGSKARPRTIGPTHIHTEEKLTMMEMTAKDRPGLLSEISAVLVELDCHVVSAAVWTHNARAACIIYMEDECIGGGPITDPTRLAHIEEQLENVVGAHHLTGERRRVHLIGPEAGQTHTERRLHQLLYEDGDFERYGGAGEVVVAEERRSQSSSMRKMSTSSSCCEAEVLIDNCNEKGYSVVQVTSRDRPKLLFDTVCTLTDMEYVVFHAAICSKGSQAIQEYYIRHMDGCTMDTEAERQRVIQCLVAAIGRRVSQGLRLDVHTRNRVGLLSDITRVFREHGLSISRAEIGTRGDRAIGSFYVTDASGLDVDSRTVELVKEEIGGTSMVINRSPVWNPRKSSYSGMGEPPKRSSSSLGSLLWAQLERLSSNFGSIKS